MAMAIPALCKTITGISGMKTAMAITMTGVTRTGTRVVNSVIAIQYMGMTGECITTGTVITGAGCGYPCILANADGIN